MNNSDSTQVTFSQVYNDVKQALDGMADALKVGAEHVYTVIVRQQLVDSITYLLSYVVIIGFCFGLFKIGEAMRLKEVKKQSYNIDDNYLFVYVLSGLCGVLFLLMFAATIDNVITGFFNPEYGAIMEIKSFVK
jgi:hypothetical protein